MRQKGKQREKCKDASFPGKEQQGVAEAITVGLSDSSCSGEETESASSAVQHTPGSVDAARITCRKVTLLLHWKSSRAKDTKTAPVLLRTSPRSREERSSDGEPRQKSLLFPNNEYMQQTSGQPQTSAPRTERTAQRGQLLPSALHSCLEEIQTSNPAFPVRAVFGILQKKTSVQESAEHDLKNHTDEKRKQRSENSERLAKRLRSGLSTDGAVTMGHCHSTTQNDQETAVLRARKPPRTNRLSRTRRLKQQSGTPTGVMNNSELLSEFINNRQPLKPLDNLTGDLSFEDVLWTDKYSPQHSREVIGNTASVSKLQSWLKKWKRRVVCDERRATEGKKQGGDTDDSWDCGDFQGEAGEEQPLCNTMLITGPPGVGKTASVYACCQELGFKVFEVNCSSQRSGCHVLSQLKEATQSHLVDVLGKDPLKPTYLNNYSSAAKAETVPGKTAHPKNVAPTAKRRAAQSFGRSGHRGKHKPATATLANYFKMKARADLLHVSGLSPPDKPESRTSGCLSLASEKTVPRNKLTATSLILFEEVDVIFDDDVGFLAAIKTFMRTTKRPVVLTTNDPSFRERFSCSLEEITFKAPSGANACSYLQLVALAENARLELDDVRSLLRLSRGDIRRCLLQLQLWARSGGGQACQSGGFPQKLTCEHRSDVTERGGSGDVPLPQNDTGCTASMLGLHPVTKEHLLNLLKSPLWSEMDATKLLSPLAESWRGGVPLLYSNLELLLTLKAEGTSVHFLDEGLQSGLSPPDLHIKQPGGNVSPKAPVTNCRSFRNISRLSRRKNRTTFDNTSSSSVTQSLQRASSLNRAPPRDKTGLSKVSAHYLEALVDFFDLMSYLNATMPTSAPLVSGPCRPGAFVWTGAEIKDGLLDEMTEEEEEEGRGRRQERLLDIQVAVEGLGCHRCLRRVSKAQTEVQQHRQEVGDQRRVESLTLPASSRRRSLSFSVQPLCAPSVSQRRYKLTRTVLRRNPFCLLGNRTAVTTDYMPVLRSICRSQRAQQQEEEPVRCLNYLSSKHLGLSKSTIQLLAEDFS